MDLDCIDILYTYLTGNEIDYINNHILLLKFVLPVSEQNILQNRNERLLLINRRPK